MAKRFTDRNKWQDEWYLNLNNDHRIVWEYMLDTCTIAGRLKKNFKLLNFCCNVELDEAKLMDIFGDRLVDCDKFFFIPKYLKFQYAKGIGSQKPAIVSVRNELIEHSLIGLVKESFGNDYVTLTNDSLIIKDKDKSKDKRKVKDKDKYTPEFENFWRAYPRKVDKKKTFISWKRVSPDEALLGKILKAIDDQKQSDQWTKDKGQFIPHPTTWLNGGRYEDELGESESLMSDYEKEMRDIING